MNKLLAGPFLPVQDQINRFFPPDTHPYRVLEREVSCYVTPGCSVLDIGCGRTAPVLSTFKGRGARLYGIDVVEFKGGDPEITLLDQSVCDMKGIASSSIDIAYSRSVMEHIDDVQAAYREIYRVLKRGGRYIFITPSIYDYATLIARVVPNKFHPSIVRFTGGRPHEDTFPAYYKSNSKHAITKHAKEAGFKIASFEYLGQYPSYLVFARPLFWAGCLYEKMIAGVRPLHFLRGWIFAVLVRS